MQIDEIPQNGTPSSKVGLVGGNSKNFMEQKKQKTEKYIVKHIFGCQHYWGIFQKTKKMKHSLGSITAENQCLSMYVEGVVPFFYTATKSVLYLVRDMHNSYLSSSS